MAKKFSFLSYILFLALFQGLVVSSASGIDRVNQPGGIKDGETLVSPGGTFVLGFFSPVGSNKRYLGIWFSVSSKEVVWVANREKPVNDSSGILLLDSNGNLFLTANTSEIFWSAGKSSSFPTTAKLMETGNFILVEESGPTQTVLWQSFDYPTDTLLPEMKVGPDYLKRRDRNLTSWKSDSDPSPGQYVYRLDDRGMGQPFLLNNLTPIYRSGPWNGKQFSGNQVMKTYTNYTFTVVQNKVEMYYQYTVTEASILARLVVDPSGGLTRFQWNFKSQEWGRQWKKEDTCDNYAYCGPNAVCKGDASLVCRCFSGFLIKHKDEWDIKKWSGGCVRKTNLSCLGDDFLLVKWLKLPDTMNSTVDMNLNIEECREKCLKNCSCVAYSTAIITGGGSGCIMWDGDLIDVKSFSEEGQDLFLRLAKSDVEEIRGKQSRKKLKIIVGVTVAAVSASVFLLLLGYWAWRRTNRSIRNTAANGSKRQSMNAGPTEENGELALFDYATLAVATDNFNPTNMIGTGGYGDVYKGILRDGQIVAVKKLSIQSGERISEFMTEVKLIAKFQHRNLVRLLGCCTDSGERLLVYEYVANRSLDFFIFGNREMRQLLGWETRLDVITGVARGLLYLHQDSRLKVIHRDLKAANILLDEVMNPKISDFGTARIFERDQIEDTTIKVVGTIGYMSPEYIMSGNFSEKSDVFSFGVLVVEIICGRRNKWVSQRNPCMELLANAWTLCAENQCHGLLDDTLSYTKHLADVFRCIQVGLLCVQESPDDRPTMQEVVLMLANKSIVLAQPEKPGFFRPTSLATASHWFADGSDSPSTEHRLTITNLEGR